MSICKDFLRYNKLLSIAIIMVSLILGFLNSYSLFLVFKISGLITEESILINKFILIFSIAILLNNILDNFCTYSIKKKIYTEEEIYYNQIFLDKPITYVKSENLNTQNNYNILKNFLKEREESFVFLSTLVQSISFISSASLYILTINKFAFFIIILSMIVYISLNYFIDNKTKEIWPKYISNMRISNVFNNILIDKDHLYERSLFNYKEFIQSKFLNSFSSGMKINKRLGQEKARYESLLSLVLISTNFLLIFILANSYKKEMIYFPDMLLVFSFKLAIDWDIESMLEGKNTILKYKIAIGLLENIDSIDNKPLNNEINKNLYDIVFDHVYFSYPGSDRSVVKDFSYTFKSASSYLIVGENGAGKSTIIKLLLGLYKPSKGSVTINGVDAYKLSSEEKSEIFSVLLQDSSKYPFTIRENIELGKKKNYSSAIEELAKNFKNGIDSNLSKFYDKPVDLSGGQWQKIFIERIYGDENKIQILDEPTAGLDPMAELEFYRKIDDFTNNDLSIYISHRMGIVSICDRILVIKDNILAEEGDFEDLIERKGIFYDFYKTQRDLYI